MDHTAAMGGGEVALYNLVRHLDRRRYRPAVLLFSDGPLASRLRGAGIEMHILSLSSEVLGSGKDKLGIATLLRLRDVFRTLVFIQRVARFIRDSEAGIVHTNSLKSDIIAGLAARLVRRPLVWHVRDRIEEDYLPSKVVKLFRLLGRVLPAAVVANSRATLRTMRLPDRKAVEVIYSGVDLERSPVGARAPLTTSASASEGARIGLVGRISPWKGQHVFLRAAADVLRRFPATRFQIIGAALFQEREYEAQVRALARELKIESSVEFLGFRDDVPKLVASLDVLVHASTTGEPFGQVVVEGMAAQRPVVATNGGGIPEIVVDGVTGILVPMDDGPAMANAICRILDDPSRAGEMGVQGRRRVEECFTIQLSARRLEAFYDRIMCAGSDHRG